MIDSYFSIISIYYGKLETLNHGFKMTICGIINLITRTQLILGAIPMKKAGNIQTSKVVIYARVSSKEQEKEGFSIPAQLKLLNSYAAEQGFQEVKEFVDVETAKKTGRPGFNSMVDFFKKAIKSKSPKEPCLILLVERTDRLYRNLKDWVTTEDLV